MPSCYNAEKVIGRGSFGIVYVAEVVHTDDEGRRAEKEKKERVAIKKVFQDRRYRNRELAIVQEITRPDSNGLVHPNITQLRHQFFTVGEQADHELFLNLVMEYLPETLYDTSRRLRQEHGGVVPLLYLKIYMFQLLRALAHLEGCDIMHRDLKPQNLLVDSQTNELLKLCDFGSAKAVDSTDPSVEYICSRYYRAPELVFGSTSYDTSIDVWSAGCVFGEILNAGLPLFPGVNGVDQVVQILKVLGTPTPSDLFGLRQEWSQAKTKWPQISAIPFRDRLPKHARKYHDAHDLLTRLLKWNPNERLRPLHALTHDFFTEVRNKSYFTSASGRTLFPPKNMNRFTDSERRVADEQMIKQLKMAPPSSD